MDQSLDGRAILVTGANGGLGQHFVREALERGARTVYAATRTPRQWDDERVRPLSLDLTAPEDAARTAAAASDVDLVVNNAGIAPPGDYLTGPEDEVRRVFETNFFGNLRVATAFAPVLAANGGGTLLNILSAAAWTPVPTAYGASKAAMWAATNGLRTILQRQGTHVAGLLVGMVDTPMGARWDVPKVSPESVVAQAYDGLAAGLFEIHADEPTRDLKSRLGDSPQTLYPWLDEQLGAFEP
ncbi:MAG TPA: SDR family oxidoreductase [Promicromonospora sp.]|nr:SDR family oxidoreductase [Promicromonospora sp.]